MDMDLSLLPELASGYHSRAQVARVVTEEWGARNLYCPACTSNTLAPMPPNTRVVDFQCPVCGQLYQLKSSKTWNETRIMDAAYDAMVAAIRSDATPNLFVMQYTPDWLVRNLLLVPRFFFTESVIEKRKPLSSKARRAGWVGCNIVLGDIPTDGKLRLILNSEVIGKSEVREQFQRVQPLASLGVNLRGWTLDVLKVVRRLGKREFSLPEMYQFEHELGELHPDNQNVRPKIRQQLQILRDVGLLEFEGQGHYKLR